MNKIKIIISKEYLTRVRKKSFLVLTILGPLMICALAFAPALLMESAGGRTEILVVDRTAELMEDKSLAIFQGNFSSNEVLHFSYTEKMETAEKVLKDQGCDGVLEIVKTNDVTPIKAIVYYGEEEIGLTPQNEIQNQLTEVLKNSILRHDYGMNTKEIEFINNPKVDFYAKSIITGESSYNEIKMALSGVGGFLIYFFIFLFGSMVMKAVSEEKTNRIVEVLVSSVKPVQLLVGKVVAIALVGLTQCAIWIVLTAGIFTFAQTVNPELFAPDQQEQLMVQDRVMTVEKLNSVESNPANEIIQGLMSIDVPVIVIMFVFFFLTGYLLYAFLFGAVGSMIDNDTDGQQFTLPLTVPMIIAIVCLPMVMENPSSEVAFWLSMIPFTSPVVMMARIPYGVPYWELALSAGLMIVFVALSAWIAAKIYRTAILLYGKKLSYKEIWKWLRYKN